MKDSCERDIEKFASKSDICFGPFNKICALSQDQCDHIWPNFATLAKFQKSLAIFEVLFRIDKILSILWAKLIGYWVKFHVLNGQNWKQNPAIWSRCLWSDYLNTGGDELIKLFFEGNVERAAQNNFTLEIFFKPLDPGADVIKNVRVA